ncbi:MAG: alpha/beta fold hydrolase [Mesorhizobium sp.]|nr:alpha/beta fold hydrolase [Mesorhizobium sp.]TIM25686.1 MAG: alpha/beta fold hydrolase [Mesorhizobium sp.]
MRPDNQSRGRYSRPVLCLCKWLHEIKAPLLVIHGTADPIFPVQHGMALSEAVAGARLLKLKGGGHELNPGDWDRIVEAIAKHTGSKRAVDRR